MTESTDTGREMRLFVVVGVIAAVGHYGTLIGLVKRGGWGPVPATLAGYVIGGVISYALNRRLTWRSDRPHAEATWRFALVAVVGFGLTGAFMYLFTGPLGLPYLPAQLVTTGLVLSWSFLANKLWTFAVPPVA